jgi:hypothetical protein
MTRKGLLIVMLVSLVGWTTIGVGVGIGITICNSLF